MEWLNRARFRRILSYKRYANEEYHRARRNPVLEAEAPVREARREARRDPVTQAQVLEADREVETDLAE